MVSYSKVFKASGLSVSDEIKVLKEPFRPVKQPQSSNSEEASPVAESTQLAKAAERAEEILEEARQNALAIQVEAEESIKQWWAEKQSELEVISIDARQLGYEEGFLAGKRQGEEEARMEYALKLEQAQAVLDDAFQQKESIITEAEPFLLELSTVIAEQIVKHELETSPEWMIELIKQHILRFKEKEYITVCVHPEDFEFINSQRGHLIAVVNGETEIKIVPDHSVGEKGCVIRTAYGSVDARIDTQIEEIKKVILEARRGAEE
ncbi:FliH/SctL family protein [Bacillus sp. EB01]|uniref:FliH/SctL family protein n=1 Tax=Bacillus sp. EB01 TaxID=1347086 RepID=UPI0005C451D9|nr:FliH/SctL family protein [Bacillus sp. EB01]